MVRDLNYSAIPHLGDSVTLLLSSSKKKSPDVAPFRRLRPMTKPGPKPSPYTVRIASALTEEQAKALRRLVYERKQQDESLPMRWGLSDLVREIIEDHLAQSATRAVRRKRPSMHAAE